MKAQTPEDKKRIEAYNKTLDQYAKPSVTADIIAVRPAYSELDEGEWRRNPKFALEVLFIKRGQWPFEGCWALPGGFVKGEKKEDGVVIGKESVRDCAIRELREETDLKARALIPIGVFSKPDRDMRTWIISNAFVCVYPRGEGDHVRGGDDAAMAKWLRLEWPTIGGGTFSLPFYEDGKPAFCLKGTYQEDDLDGGTVMSVNDNPLAFDHAEIIAQAFLRMLAFDKKKLVFFFLPEKFTLANYIDIYQYLTDKSVDPANIPSFRRQLTETKEPLLEVCKGEWEDLGGRAHAPAKLYRRKGIS
jgi:ADP-ribose pyrophosphatase YjhB (NUDIX family)